MSAQGRLGDKGQAQIDAHGCPTCPHPAIGPGIAGSPDVMTNGRPSLRVDDPGIHTACCGTNTWTATQGAMTVFINGKSAHRKDDAQRHCGGPGRLVEGSPNVIVGDMGGGGGGGPGSGGAGAGAGSGGAGEAGAAGPSGGAGAGGAGGAPNGGTAGSGAAGGTSSGDAPTDQPDSPVEPDQIEIRIIDARGEPVGGIAYELTMPDGSVRSGFAGVDGVVKLVDLDQRGDCTLRLRSVDERGRKP